jgi:hypothetical protein
MPVSRIRTNVTMPKKTSVGRMTSAIEAEVVDRILALRDERERNKTCREASEVGSSSDRGFR